MFTGIIEEIGKIKSIKKAASLIQIEISAKTVLKDTKLGDSISVNGVCLTVTKMGRGGFTVDVMQKTFEITGLAALKTADEVNLERALRVSDRLGGHIVSGHVDCVGKVKSYVSAPGNTEMQISLPAEFLKYVVLKGSVCINGISLTVSCVSLKDFSVSIIPFTIQNTNLKTINRGDLVNVETDMFAKYVENMVNQKSDLLSMDEPLKNYDLRSFFDVNGGPSVCN